MAVSAIVSAVASSVATSVAWSVAANYAISTFTFAVIETAVGLAVGGLLNAAFAGSESASSVPNFTAEARDRTQVVRSSVANRFVVYGETIMSGPLVYAESTGDSNEYIHLVIPLANHEVESIGTVYINDEQITSEMLNVDGDVTSGKYENYVVIRKHLGAADQAADAQLVSLSGTWTANHRLQGVAYIYVRLLYSQDVFPFGLPNIKAVVKGKKLYDPRTGTTAWSDNFALCVYDYLVNEYGLSAGTDEIDSTTFQAAANVADENVTINLGGDTQKRYTCNGAIDLGNRPIDVLTELCTSGAAALVYTQGVYKLYAGDATTSTASLDESYLRGPVSVRTRKARKELFNSVRGTYLSATNFWQPTDFPEVTNSTYVTQDGSEKIYRDIQLPFTDDSLAAQRIAKIHLERSRQGITVEMPCNLKALELSPYDVVSLSIDRFGWTSKEFRIVNWQISPDGGVDLTLQEEDSTAYDWNYGEATVVDAAPDTTLPDPFTVNVPTDLTLSSGTSHLLVTGDGTVVSRIFVSWNAPGTSFTYEYDVQYKKSSDVDWISLSKIDSTSTYISPVDDGVNYDVRVRAINIIGVRGGWTTAANHLVIGKTAAPSNVTSISAQSQINGIYLNWASVSDPDLSEYVLKYNTTPVWTGTAELARVKSNNYLFNAPLAGTYYFMVKAVDTSGNESASDQYTSITINAPGAPTLAQSLSGGNVRLSWTANEGAFPISHFEIRTGGTDWASATFLTETDSTTFTEKIDYSSKKYWVSTVDIAENTSAAASADVVITGATIASFTSQVIDNNVLLYFAGNAGNLPIDSFELRRGATFAGATVIGKKTGTFTVIFEPEGGEYTYWIVPIDTAGNYGTEQSLTVTVNEPPDYVLVSNYDSDFSGTLSSVIERIDGDLLAPVTTTETWAQHFSNNSWTTIQDQINAGYPIYAEPAPTSGYYEETIDYGSSLSNQKIKVTVSKSTVHGTVTETCKISTSTDNVNWTDYDGYYEIMESSSFRYVKVRLTWSSSGGDDLVKISNINVKIDAKIKSDSGSGTANASDTGGTTVNFNKSFIDITSIVVTPNTTNAYYSVIDFTDAPNPTSFKVLIFNTSGTRVTSGFSWQARGY